MATNPLRGVGVLIVGEQSHEGARYRFNIVPAGRTRIRTLGNLSMSRKDMPAMTAALTADSVRLKLEGGEVVQIVVTHMQMMSDPPSFEFEAVGPIPGY